MKKKIVMAVAAGLIALLCFETNIVTAQSNAPVTPPGAPPPPNMPPPRATMTAVPSARTAIIFLNRTMTELHRSTNDFGGHKQAAIEACNKALTELQAVMQNGGGTIVGQPMRPVPPPGAVRTPGAPPMTPPPQPNQ